MAVVKKNTEETLAEEKEQKTTPGPVVAKGWENC